MGKLFGFILLVIGAVALYFRWFNDAFIWAQDSFIMGILAIILVAVGIWMVVFSGSRPRI